MCPVSCCHRKRDKQLIWSSFVHVTERECEHWLLWSNYPLKLNLKFWFWQKSNKKVELQGDNISYLEQIRKILMHQSQHTKMHKCIWETSMLHISLLIFQPHLLTFNKHLRTCNITISKGRQRGKFCWTHLYLNPQLSQRACDGSWSSSSWYG